MITMKMKDAEKQFNIELVDRTHLGKDDVEYWLEQECEIVQENGKTVFYCNNGEVGEI